MRKKAAPKWSDELRQAILQFISREGIPVVEVSRRAGILQQTLHMFLTTDRSPTLDNAQRLAKVIGFNFTHKADSK